MTVGRVSYSHPHGDQQLVGYCDILAMDIEVGEAQPPHDNQQLVNYPDSDSD